MNMAKNNPVNKPQRELSTDDVKVNQRPARNLDDPDYDGEVVSAIMDGRDQAYLDELAFMEEAVTIRIQKGSEKHAPPVVSCWVNGKGAEQLTNGKWMVCGWLPVNHPVVTKRKYVEVLARSRTDTITTDVVKREHDEDNLAIPNTSTKYPFTVIGDSARGNDWLTRILTEQ